MGSLFRVVLSCAAVFALTTSSARADEDDEDDDDKVLALGETVHGTFTEKGAPTYRFHGREGDIVTLTLEGKTAEQIGVVMVRSDKDFDFEWITGNYIDDFKDSGNIRDGNKLRLTLRLPMNAKHYTVFIRDALFNDEEAPYSLRLDGAGATGPRKAYVRGSISAGGGLLGSDGALALNATLAVGQQRDVKLGVEGVLSGTFFPLNDTTLMGFLGIGARVRDPKTSFSGRYAVGLAGMLGVTDHLGVGVRMDSMIKRFDLTLEAARIGRTNVLLTMIGVKL